MGTLMKEHQTTHMEMEYLNDFHRRWNEACMVTCERTKSMRFTHEYAKEKSRKLAETALLSVEEVLRRRKLRPKAWK